ncbi:MAG: YjbQ family protein [Desulfobacterales bacterium]|jgi:secondary thiamine-phosphate synthase enzyme|nr:YjbQ family protein [Desulfobacterales bacterium]TET54515.1 MAG: YjbQ family protein [Desulfobacteraceae bacterium]UCG64674.1 MAG: YjbQ family protein [Deltaproteobacteria bacterium]
MVSTIGIKTRDRSEMIDITSKVEEELQRSGLKDGVCFLYVPHTTAGITINESADPSVVVDIQTTLDKLVPWEAAYRHREGNSAAHIKSSLVGNSAMVLAESGHLKLGTWQGIFFCEFDGPRSRKLYMKFQ